MIALPSSKDKMSFVYGFNSFSSSQHTEQSIVHVLCYCIDITENPSGTQVVQTLSFSLPQSKDCSHGCSPLAHISPTFHCFITSECLHRTALCRVVYYAAKPSKGSCHGEVQKFRKQRIALTSFWNLKWSSKILLLLQGDHLGGPLCPVEVQLTIQLPSPKYPYHVPIKGSRSS